MNSLQISQRKGATMKDAFNKARTATGNFLKTHRTKVGIVLGVALTTGAMAGAKVYKDRKGSQPATASA